MEGPTPVSALIHAATLVTAGVFLLIRCSFIFEYSDLTLFIILVLGGLTALFGAVTALMQNDIKKVVAFSTTSQLGYMVFCCGFSGYNIALFHLVNHAFFKSLLFLASGVLIHGLFNDQDLRNYGGLIKLVPFTYSIMFIGFLSLSGFPFLSGFYSKEIIIESSFTVFSISGVFVY
jgi:NADH:ubiquinone oxidoreductase subunit 5 (subunit L)/multisubunit Na+/H+ antiporter MnhA subunit